MLKNYIVYVLKTTKTKYKNIKIKYKIHKRILYALKVYYNAIARII